MFNCEHYVEDIPWGVEVRVVMANDQRADLIKELIRGNLEGVNLFSGKVTVRGEERVDRVSLGVSKLNKDMGIGARAKLVASLDNDRVRRVREFL